MRGAKGGFWNLLLERFRMRRLKKKKLKNEEEKLNDLKIIKEINNKKKKEKEIIINCYIKENKKKYKLEKIPKKVKIVNIHKVKIPTYYKECLGSFAKGISDNDTGEKLKGMEFIWCRGNFMPTKEMIKLKKWYTE